jgi:hypothetical protein
LEKAIEQAGVEFRPSGSSQPVRATTVDAWRDCYYELNPVKDDDTAGKESRKKAFGRGVEALLKKAPSLINTDGKHFWDR